MCLTNEIAIFLISINCILWSQFMYNYLYFWCYFWYIVQTTHHLFFSLAPPFHLYRSGAIVAESANFIIRNMYLQTVMIKDLPGPFYVKAFFKQADVNEESCHTQLVWRLPKLAASHFLEVISHDLRILRLEVRKL